MAYFLFKCWHERLFVLKREDLVRPEPKELKIDFVPITDDNIEKVAELRGEQFVLQFKQQLSFGDFGYYACIDGNPVGYGWVKHPCSDDYFFNISDACCYLCRFFVHESVRGNGIYPAIICKLIEKEFSYDTFYIAAERGNCSSERGLSKVGFSFVKEFGFIRGFKKTFNKKILVGLEK